VLEFLSENHRENFRLLVCLFVPTRLALLHALSTPLAAMNRSLRIEYPSTLPDALHQTPEEFEKEARYAMAVKLFEMKRVSSGQAAQLAGIDRTTFLMRLSESGVAAIDHSVEELADDVRNAGPA
jgi:predicted HTH domain antitoxin